jgi:hypothetical protein
MLWRTSSNAAQHFESRDSGFGIRDGLFIPNPVIPNPGF